MATLFGFILPPKLWYFIHHRETKEQENLKFLPEEQFFVSLSHGIPPSSPFFLHDRAWSASLCFVCLLLCHLFMLSDFTPYFFACDVSFWRWVCSSGYRSRWLAPPSCPRIIHRLGPRAADVGAKPAPSSEERNVVDNSLTGAAAGTIVGQGGHLVVGLVFLFDFTLGFPIG